MTVEVSAPAVAAGPCLGSRLDEYDAIARASGCTAASLVGAAGAENTREAP